MRTLVREFKVEKKKIGFIRFIFEAHEGVATVTTLDAGTGHILLRIPPERLETALKVIDDLKKDFTFDACS